MATAFYHDERCLWHTGGEQALFVPAGGMETRRQSFTATRLANDRVLLTGGSSQSWMSADTAELYDLATTPVLTTTSVPDGQPTVAYPNMQEPCQPIGRRHDYRNVLRYPGHIQSAGRSKGDHCSRPHGRI